LSLVSDGDITQAVLIEIQVTQWRIVGEESWVSGSGCDGWA